MDTIKDFNSKHEVVIHSRTNAIFDGKEPKQGEVVPHKKVVSNCVLYQLQQFNGGEIFFQVWLSRNMILDLAEQIKTIETEIINTPYDSLPF